MLSRVASHAYWLGRYLERAEDLARTMYVHDLMLMDLREFDRTTTWHQIVAVNGNEKILAELYAAPNENDIVSFLVVSPENPSSLLNTLNGARYNLRVCRSTIPKAMYELVNELCLFATDETVDGVSNTRRRRFLRSVEHQLLAIAGAASGSMSYDTGFLFMRIGCFLERADMTSRILDVRSANLLSSPDLTRLSPYENSQWIAILQSLQAYQVYMSETHRPINGPDVLNFVLKNPDHPKSFRFCIDRLSSFIQRLPNIAGLQDQVSRLVVKIDEADVHQLAQNQLQLHHFVDELQVDLGQLGEDFINHYFPAPEELVELIDESSKSQAQVQSHDEPSAENDQQSPDSLSNSARKKTKKPAAKQLQEQK